MTPGGGIDHKRAAIAQYGHKRLWRVRVDNESIIRTGDLSGGGDGLFPIGTVVISRLPHSEDHGVDYIVHHPFAPGIDENGLITECDLVIHPETKIPYFLPRKGHERIDAGKGPSQVQEVASHILSTAKK